MAEKFIRGNNWVKLQPSFIQWFKKKCIYAVVDIVLPDGQYFLDRYMIRHKIHAEYPGKQLVHPDYPHCEIYGIVVSIKDESELRKALDEMYCQSPLTEYGEEYQKCIEFIKRTISSHKKE